MILKTRLMCQDLSQAGKISFLINHYTPIRDEGKEIQLVWDVSDGMGHLGDKGQS